MRVKWNSSLETIPFWVIDRGTLNDGENDGTVTVDELYQAGFREWYFDLSYEVWDVPGDFAPQYGKWWTDSPGRWWLTRQGYVGD